METRKHMFVDTIYGEVMVVESFDVDNQRDLCDVYIGDNYDQYVGSISCTLDDDEDEIIKEVEDLIEQATM